MQVLLVLCCTCLAEGSLHALHRKGVGKADLTCMSSNQNENQKDQVCTYLCIVAVVKSMVSRCAHAVCRGSLSCSENNVPCPYMQ